ncbi:MAG: AbrB/MazE/SpoVT family DNA-binding domain-containing protein [bacterium]|nr:AbrB/MazE/SpoVT family DNA-binding domain-containing protein [bacterium]
MNITQSLKKWGNGQGVRLPKQVVAAARLGENSRLEISLRGRSIVLTPVSEEHTLEAMLAGVTPEAVGGEFDLGTDVGAERID